ncbi:MAG: EthD family reductase [Chloroflexi bacterium]|nr:EthD family reductase [Chloroflexota bacterium]
MHKLVILIEQPEAMTAFDDAWPEFLHNAERMPGLRREATSRVEAVLQGNVTYAMMHELFFDTFDAVREAMASPEGRRAGQLLYALSGGRLAFFIADHREDDAANLLASRSED